MTITDENIKKIKLGLWETNINWFFFSKIVVYLVKVLFLKFICCRINKS